jgi:hypothetical protein
MAPQVLNSDSVAIADHRPHKHGEKLPMASDSYWPAADVQHPSVADCSQSETAFQL